jgi:shikimate dehydrogenase
LEGPADRPTRRLLLGLIGAGIQASRTPSMHEREAAAHGIRCLYQLLDLDVLNVDAGAIDALVDAAERTGFGGLNITHPCKQRVIDCVTELSDAARGIGAVNTVVFRDGRRVGHNTDWWAFRESVRTGLSGATMNRVLQLGAGGAGAATAYAALEMGVQHLDIVDIVPARASALVDRLNGVFDGRAHVSSCVEAAIASADGLIHATPTGMAAHPGLPLSADLLRPDLWVAEVVYFPLDTALLRAARARGCRTVDGSGMAIWQAVDAFRLFTGIEPDADRMRTFFNEAVSA